MSASVFTRQMTVFIDANLSPAAQSALLAKVAKEDVAQMIATGRAPEI